MSTRLWRVLGPRALLLLAGCTDHEHPPSPGPSVDERIDHDAAAVPTAQEPGPEAGASDSGASSVGDAGDPAIRWHHLSALGKLDAGACSDSSPKSIDVYVEIVGSSYEDFLRIRIPRLQVEETFFKFCSSAGLGCILTSRGDSAIYYFGTDMFEEWGAVRACGSQLVVRRSTKADAPAVQRKSAIYTLPCGAEAALHVVGARGAKRLQETGSPVERGEPTCPP